MRNKKIYCIYCGEKNNKKDVKCKKCKKKLDPKENLVLDYIKDHFKSDVEGNIITLIKNFITSHLYGSILTATLIFTVVSAVVTTIGKDGDVLEVTEKPMILVNNINKCVFASSKEPIDVCNEGYILEEGTCIREETYDAITSRVCPDQYALSGNSCISNANFNMLTKQECIAPTGANVSGSHIQDGVCYVEYCVDWTDGVCSAGSSEPIDFTTTSYCPNGTKLVNGVCKKYSNYTVSYHCEEGTLSHDKCVVVKEEEPDLGCEAGYTLNEECNLCVLGE